MDLLIKAVSCGLISLVLSVILPTERKDIRILMGVATCCAMSVAVVYYLQPVIDVVDRVKEIGRLNTKMITILWKIVGVSIVTEISSLICKDMDNGTLAKMLCLVSDAAIVWLTIPLFQEFIDLVENVLERM